MALIVKTDNPSDLIAKIKNEINEGSIDTWEIDDDGDFTHSPEQWRNQAWMHQNKENKEIVFGIIGNKQVTMTKSLYAIYHGHFAEMLLAHFDDIIHDIKITSGKTKFDYF